MRNKGENRFGVSGKLLYQLKCCYGKRLTWIKYLIKVRCENSLLSASYIIFNAQTLIYQSGMGFHFGVHTFLIFMALIAFVSCIINLLLYVAILSLVLRERSPESL